MYQNDALSERGRLTHESGHDCITTIQHVSSQRCHFYNEWQGLRVPTTRYPGSRSVLISTLGLSLILVGTERGMVKRRGFPRSKRKELKTKRTKDLDRKIMRLMHATMRHGNNRRSHDQPEKNPHARRRRIGPPFIALGLHHLKNRDVPALPESLVIFTLLGR